MFVFKLIVSNTCTLSLHVSTETRLHAWMLKKYVALMQYNLNTSQPKLRSQLNWISQWESEQRLHIHDVKSNNVHAASLAQSVFI